MNVDGIIKKINMKPSSIERSIITANLFNYLRFLRDSKQISDKDLVSYVAKINDTHTYSKHYIQAELPRVREILDITGLLNELYINVLNHANRYQLFTPNLPETNIIKLIKYAKEFFKYIDNDFYKLFMTIVDNNRLFESEKLDYGGICFNIGQGQSALVLRYDTYNLYKIFTLVHEMGHAYHNYLTRAKPLLNQTYLSIECISRTFEQLFFIFLRDNHLLDNNSLDTYERIFHMHQLKITNSSYIVNRLLLEKSIPTNFYLNRIKPDLTYEEYQQLSIIKVKCPEYQNFLSYDYNFYSYAFMFSLIMREMFIEDERNAKKFIQNFTSYDKNLSAFELLNLFDKTEYLNATNKNTSRILSKTKYKK